MQLRWPDSFIGKIIKGDCLEVMPGIPDKSVDMILCDLPYGTTACKWDTRIPLEPLWAEYKRIVKNRAAIVLTASQPFTSILVCSNLGMFKYCWVWEKGTPSGRAHALNMPLRSHEDVIVFSCGKIAHKHSHRHDRMQYNPQGVLPPMRQISGAQSMRRSEHKEYRKGFIDGTPYKGSNYPKSIICCSNASNRERGSHPTQKPVALFEYLIKTYTNPGDLVLDNCIGSGTTAVACINTGRRFIGIEKEREYCEIARKRITEAERQPMLLQEATC